MLSMSSCSQLGNLSHAEKMGGGEVTVLKLYDYLGKDAPAMTSPPLPGGITRGVSPR